MKNTLALVLFLLVIPHGVAEQKEVFDGVEVHYIVLPTTSLSAEIATQYGIPRAPRRGFVNVSVLNSAKQFEAMSAQVSVQVKNLLGQNLLIEMREVNEPPARYYLGTFEYSDEETMRFTFSVTLPDGRSHTFLHSQKMFKEQ